MTVFDVCTAYLAKVADSGAPSTFESRQRTLFDFTIGLPSRFVPKPGKEEKKPKRSDYLHDGFGKLSVPKLKPLHLDKWLQAPPVGREPAEPRSKQSSGP
ncbi:hypothetical protein Mal64_27100 [Pseudobythopirellula maris]|uniref:Uncharacterized protein n=1 Tax=Pseudobythopirellula maris TaxID=2527991 RepID=A0A5C5ZII8_9BACT|nr:hypothetical protein [Pseudobythopirellula maris]TWT87174.1 hypothetical protein Mal64_27100 [Pseudobythopirellula maris]